MTEKIDKNKLVFGIYYDDIREIAEETFNRILTNDELDAVFDELIDLWHFDTARWDMEDAIREGISKALKI